jgi:DNA-binding Lrp family transcriptional regulator
MHLGGFTVDSFENEIGMLAGGSGETNGLNWQKAQTGLSEWRYKPPEWHMADIDQQLLTLLRHNARRSISDLAAELGVSRATVRARIERMERQGDIVGYTVILRTDAVSMPVRGIMLIEVEGRAADRVVGVLGGFPEVSAVHTTNGRWDLVVELGTDSLADLDAVLRRVRMIAGITASETNLLLATPRSTRAKL